MLAVLVERGFLSLQEEVPHAETLGAGCGEMEEDLGKPPDTQPGGDPVVPPEAPLVSLTPRVVGVGEGKPMTIPRYDPLSSISTASSDARMKLCIARLQLETQEKEREFQLRRELEFKWLEADTAVRMRQLELQSGSGQWSSLGVNSPSDGAVEFNVAKNVALVPTFRESEVESYFGAFERIAAALKWAILLQCKLIGKAQEACASLSMADSLVYDKVKSAIYRVYELVPEAYRQRFRSLRRAAGQTHSDFAREKGIRFDRWCAACKAEEFSLLRELMLEEFKDCVSERTAVYLNEQKVITLQQAATLADEYELTHKTVFNKQPSFSQKGSSVLPKAVEPKAAEPRTTQSRAYKGERDIILYED